MSLPALNLTFIRFPHFPCDILLTTYIVYRFLSILFPIYVYIFLIHIRNGPHLIIGYCIFFCSVALIKKSKTTELIGDRNLDR
jgi:hypothetical protein